MNVNFTILFIIISSYSVFSQNNYAEALNYLQKRNEIYFKTYTTNQKIEQKLINSLVLDKKQNDSLYFYADSIQFKDFLSYKLPYKILIPPSLKYKPNRNKSGMDIRNWNDYPTYQEYISMMDSFATARPDLCSLHEIGTSIEGRKILAVKISDSVTIHEHQEPEFLYTATMHGDEVVGYVLMLRLIDFLLNNYEKDTLVTKLVNNIEIWINPLSNPDGTYAGGNNSVYGATRCNSWGCSCGELNRAFPDPDDGPHPNYCDEYPPEVIAMMDFMKKHNFILSANLHGGSECVNYPWDTWEKRHADDAWYQFIGRQYADTAHQYNENYMTDFNNGITNGYDWYHVAGGRQDYVTYFLHGREVTLELDMYKTPNPTMLPDYWEYNYRSFLHYIEQSMFGLKGKITDKTTGKPIKAKIKIKEHDQDNSFVFSDSIGGYYHRMIDAGTYTIEISATNYYTTTISDIKTENNQTTILDIELLPYAAQINSLYDKQLKIYPNPIENKFTLKYLVENDTSFLNTITISLIHSSGKLISQTSERVESGQLIKYIDIGDLSSGVYFLKLQSDKGSFVKKIIKK